MTIDMDFLFQGNIHFIWRKCVSKLYFWIEKKLHYKIIMVDPCFVFSEELVMKNSSILMDSS